VRPYSKLAQARKRKASWERQLQSALEQEGRARRTLRHHRQRLERLIAERDALLNWLAQLEVDNATNPNPVRIRWLLDGGFGDAANMAGFV
jgi:chromosome segregation ATPase